MDAEQVLLFVLLSFIMWMISAAIYTRVAPKSQLIKNTVGL
jgi:hypothetical protein